MMHAAGSYWTLNPRWIQYLAQPMSSSPGNPSSYGHCSQSSRLMIELALFANGLSGSTTVRGCDGKIRSKSRASENFEIS